MNTTKQFRLFHVVWMLYYLLYYSIQRFKTTLYNIMIAIIVFSVVWTDHPETWG